MILVINRIPEYQISGNHDITSMISENQFRYAPDDSGLSSVRANGHSSALLSLGDLGAGVRQRRKWTLNGGSLRRDGEP